MAKYRFDQIAINSIEKKKPVEEDRFTYIGLEHLDSGSLTVSRYGSDVAPVGEKLIMHKGDVLFGKRRAYQKKVAIAPFDGIFSAHGMVLRPREEVVDKGFFPLFISSDYFLNAAIQISVGSLSPTINWKDLQELEFELPDLETQRKLSDVLWAIINTAEAYKRLIAVSDELVKSQFIAEFGDPIDNPMRWDTKSLLSLGSCKNGMNFHSGDTGVVINCLGVGDFKDNDYIRDTSILPTISLSDAPSDDYLLKDGDIVFVRSNGNKAMVGRSVAVFPGERPTTFSGFCIRFRKTDSSVLLPFLLRALKTDSIRKKMYGRGANIQNLNQQTLASLYIPIPPFDKQEEYISIVRQLDKSKFIYPNL